MKRNVPVFDKEMRVEDVFFILDLIRDNMAVFDRQYFALDTVIDFLVISLWKWQNFIHDRYHLKIVCRNYPVSRARKCRLVLNPRVTRMTDRPRVSNNII